MVDSTRVHRLLRGMEDTLVRVDAEATAPLTRQDDPLWLPGVKYLLLSAIEASVDVAQHLCATQGWGPPADNGDAMRLLGVHAVLSADLADAMRRAVGFRNVLVHEYVEVDDDVVRARVRHHEDLREFSRAVLAWIGARY